MGVDLSRFLPQYFEESEQSVQEIKSCLTGLVAPGWDAVRADQASRAAHSIKGNSGAFGFDEIGSLAGDIEHVLRSSGEGFGFQTNAFRLECEQACEVLADLLQARRAGCVGDENLAQQCTTSLLEWLDEGKGASKQGGSRD